MAILTIIIVLVLLWGLRNGPRKLVLNEEEAKAVRARWWKYAIGELKVWAVFLGVGYALAADTLAKAHWHWSMYVFIVWCSLLLFSRLAIWVTIAGIAGLIAVAFLAHVLVNYTIPTPPLYGPLLVAVVLAIIIRAFLLMMAKAPPQPKPTTSLPPIEDHTPKHDWNTDTWNYHNGAQGPGAHSIPNVWKEV